MKNSTRSHMLAFAHHRVQVQNERRMSCSFETEQQKLQHTSCACLIGAVPFIPCAVYASTTCAAPVQSLMYHSSVT
jgi:hypothetical protein